MTNSNQYINKAIELNIIKSQINLSLTKTDVTNILNEAMQDETASASIKRILNPFLADKFPQFPDFTAISLGETADDGSTIVALKQPVVRAKSEPTEEPIDPVVEETFNPTEAIEAPIEPESDDAFDSDEDL